MNKQDIKDGIIYFGTIIVFVGGVSWVVNHLASSVSDHEVITPKPGIECVVVSRMFNTSVDCWKVEL